MAQFVTLEEVVNELLIDEGKNTQAEFLRYYNIGLRGLKELNFDVVRMIKAVELSVSESTNTITLPSDYVKFINIAVLGSDGDLHYLGRREKLNLVDGATPPSPESDSNFFDNVDEGVYGRYGFGGGNNANGYYRENLDDNTIEFSSITGQLEKIILEYISDGSQSLTGDNIKVHTFAQEALTSFIYWKSIQRKRGINANEKLFARKEFYNQKRLARARMNTFNKYEALQTTRKAFKQAPKL
jgi:hypothetical protein|tara:strand:+ start:1405 stop:2130 length:726 start_codon:yes stop_codon:yes gene_type:complete